MVIYAGKLRHRLVIEEPSVAVDSFGQQTVIWNAVGTVWGRVEDVGGEEHTASRAVTGIGTHAVTLRYGHRLTTAMRLRWERHGKTRLFQILSISNVEERDRELELVCKESDVESDAEVGT